MSIDLNFRQDMNVSTQMKLAPQLLQWLKLLHVPTLDLSAIVQNELETNPALELADDDAGSQDAESDASMEEPDCPEKTDNEGLDEQYEFLADAANEWSDEALPADSSTRFVSENDALEKYEYAFNSIEDRDTLMEYLRKQLGLSDLPEDELELAELLIGSLDARGYLETGLEDISEQCGAPIERLEKALAAVQSLNPPGVGARDLRECLLLQMPDDAHQLARSLVSDYLDAMARKQYAEVAEILDVREQDIREAMALIRSLDPNPGENFSGHDTNRYIRPDVTIRKGERGYRVELNDSYVPRIRISASCRKLLEKGSLNPREIAYVRDKIRSANFIIQGIRQRQETLRKVAEEIVRAQHEFLDTENGKPAPLTMAQLADSIGVHETTVSRAIANKHMQTARGLFPMKQFFCSGYACSDGSSITPDRVKDLIAGIVESENPRQPFTDVRISALLKHKGLRVARRTIAKYREEMGISSSKERARIFVARRPMNRTA